VVAGVGELASLSGHDEDAAMDLQNVYVVPVELSLIHI